jgi:large subunit ribosomal protein L6
MSRIGKKPVVVPDKVSVQLTDRVMAVKGPKGNLSEVLPLGVVVKIEGNQVLVERADESRDSRAAHGLARTLVANMVDGVTTGFTKKLMITGVGYRAELKGPQWLLFSLGYSHPILYELPVGVSAVVDNKENSVTLSGYHKQVLGTVAAEIRSLRPPEPYKGKGVRYADETIRRKEGKSSGKGK